MSNVQLWCPQSSWLRRQQQQRSSLTRLEPNNWATLRLKKGLVFRGGSEAAPADLPLLRGSSEEQLSSSELRPSDQDTVPPSDQVFASLGGDLLILVWEESLAASSPLKDGYFNISKLQQTETNLSFQA